MQIYPYFFPFPTLAMVFPEPDYPHIVLSFVYRDMKLELEETTDQGVPMYSVWANHAHGCAVAVAATPSRREALYKARAWVDRRLQQRTESTGG